MTLPNMAQLLVSAAEAREDTVQAILNEVYGDLRRSIKENGFVIPRKFTVICSGMSPNGDVYAITRSQPILNEAAARVEGELAREWPKVTVTVRNWWSPFSPRLYIDLGGL